MTLSRIYEHGRYITPSSTHRTNSSDCFSSLPRSDSTDSLLICFFQNFSRFLHCRHSRLIYIKYLLHINSLLKVVQNFFQILPLLLCYIPRSILVILVDSGFRTLILVFLFEPVWSRTLAFLVKVMRYLQLFCTLVCYFP